LIVYVFLRAELGEEYAFRSDSLHSGWVLAEQISFGTAFSTSMTVSTSTPSPAIQGDLHPADSLDTAAIYILPYGYHWHWY